MNRLDKPSPVNLTGCMLVAAPGWDDPVLRRSVCLVMHHGPDRSICVLLNRSIKADVQSLLQQFGSPTSNRIPELFLGGHQSGPVVAMHQQSELAEFVSAEGVYFAAQVESLKKLVSQDTPCRIYLGQEIWGAGQLDIQFEQGKWLPLQISPRVAFEAADAMWYVALREAGNKLVEGWLSTGSPNRLEDN